LSKDKLEIKANMAARLAASECLSFAQDSMRMHSTRDVTVDEDRFWECVATQAAAHLGMKLVMDGPSDKMSDREASRFEDTVMPFGIHRNSKVGDVAPSYFVSLLEGEFTQQLKRYVGCKRFMDRQR